MSAPVIAPKTNTLALIGFIAASVAPIVGLILGIRARRQLHRSGNVAAGRAFARWAIIVGAVGTAVQVAFFLAMATLFTVAIIYGGVGG